MIPLPDINNTKSVNAHYLSPNTTNVLLKDQFGRVHNNLRISVTDRCNLRCVYCMPEDVTFLDRKELLSFEEIAKFVSLIAPLGVNKIRLTGGEPLMRKNIPALVKMLLEIPGIDDIGLTTNAILLADQAEALYGAGLRRLNISLDTLDRDRFRELARRDGLEETLSSLQVAKRLGFSPIKVNAVAMKGYIEHDLIPMANYCRKHGFELRLIEYMPIGAEAWERNKCVLAHQLMEMIEQEIAPLLPAKNYDPSAPAMDFEYADGRGRVGIIASVSKPFCKSCNRLRLTADGKIRNCLFALDEIDVKALLREQPINEEAIRNAVQGNIWSKWEGHEINSAKFIKPTRTMHAIGG